MLPFRKCFKLLELRLMVESTKHTNDPSTLLKGVIAVVGCDGTGKTTLTADLRIKLGEKRPTVWRYLGLISGESGKKIGNVPLIGVRLEKYLTAKAMRAQDMKKKVPGIVTAMTMHLLSMWRMAHLFLVRNLSRKGILVIADRYPQAEVPGFHYDGPGITAEPSDNWLLHILAAREQKLYNSMAKLKPALIIRLNLDPETAHARKPDHDINELRDKSSILPRLNYNGSNIHDIDASMSYAQVLEEALQAINHVIGPETAG